MMHIHRGSTIALSHIKHPHADRHVNAALVVTTVATISQVGGSVLRNNRTSAPENTHNFYVQPVHGTKIPMFVPQSLKSIAIDIPWSWGALPTVRARLEELEPDVD